MSPTSTGLSAVDLVEVCVRAERAGYRAAWLAEVAGPEAFALAGAVARATREIDLGIAVVAASTRTPALLAMGAATVSQLAAGRRFALGIGSSSHLIVESWHGRSFDPPLRRVAETVRATRAALGGERTFHGDTVSMERFPLGAAPAGPVEIFVGALGPGMLGVAGAVADGVCLNLMPPGVVARQLAAVRRGAADAGRKLPADFGVMARIHVVPDDDLDTARGVIRAAFGPYFAQPVYNRFLAWCGYPEAAAAIAAAFAAGDRSGVAAGMSDELIDEIALVGSVARIRERLPRYAEGGVGVAALNVIAPTADAVAATLEALV